MGRIYVLIGMWCKYVRGWLFCVFCVDGYIEKDLDFGVFGMREEMG